MKLTDQIEQNVAIQFDELQHEKLLLKYKDLTHVTAYEGFYKGVRYVGHIAQVFSLILAVGFPILMAQKFPSLQFPIFCLFLSLLAMLEIGKHGLLSKLNAVRIVNKNSQFPVSLKHYIVGAIFLFGLSVGTSYMGSETVVTALTEHRELEDLATISASFDTMETDKKAYWSGLVALYDNKAKEIHSQNSWKGRTSRDARGAKLGAETQSLSAQQNLSDALLLVEADRSLAVNSATNRNKNIVAEHQIWCKSFSNFAALLAFVLDFLLIVLLAWHSDFDYRKIKENESRKSLILEGQKAPVLNSFIQEGATKGKESVFLAKEEEKETLKSAVKQPVTNMQIKTSLGLKQGDVIEAEGRRSKRIAVELSDGSVVLRTEGELRNLIKGNSKGGDMTRANELTELLKNFNL